MLMPQISKKGFTLIEVLVTVSIISLLTVMGVVSYRQTAINARDAKRMADIEAVRQMLVLYKTDEGGYPILATPDSVANYNSLTTYPNFASYISGGTLPVDPTNRSPYFYQYFGNATQFNLCANLEKTGLPHCVTNP